MGGAYGTNRRDEECHELVAVIDVCRVRLGEQVKTNTKMEFFKRF
jgi:hypothetical protein